MKLLKYNKLVHKLVHKARQNLTIRELNRIEPEDLEQIAWMALLKARKGFDKKRGIKFITYAYRFVELDIRRAIREERRYFDRQIVSSNLDTVIKNEALLDIKIEEAEILAYAKHKLDRRDQRLLKNRYEKSMNLGRMAKLHKTSISTLSTYMTEIIYKLRRIINRANV